jgi:hypothetical protein
VPERARAPLAAKGPGEIAAAIEELRRQLTEVQKGSADERLRFSVKEVEMEFLVTVSTEGSGGAGVRLGLVTVGADAKVGKDNSHRLLLKLDVRDTQSEDGEATVSGRR